MFSPRLAAFIRDSTRVAAFGDEPDVRRALCSPFSGVPNVDARAIATVAGDRRTARETIERDCVPLSREGALSAKRFLTRTDALGNAFRAQGSTAKELVAAIGLTFDFAEPLDERERRTLLDIETLAAGVDGGELRTQPWDPHSFLRALEELGRTNGRDSLAPQASPLSAREPEAPHDVKRRRAHFSASSLGMYALCERRWYYRYVCGAVEDRGSSASFYGSAFHWALERFHQEFPRAGSAPPATLESKLDAYVGDAFDRFRSGFATNVEYELQRRRARRTARRYLAWFLERSRAHPFTVIGTETSVELRLGDYEFVGYIDRLDRDDATAAITVIDYKTGTIAESAFEYRAKVAQFVDFQLPFYYWARTAAGDRVTRLALVPLKDAHRAVRPIELEVVPVAAPRSYSDAAAGTIGIDELERARAKMIELAATLADAPILRFAVTSDPETCAFCSYQLACRERPLAREDRFGR